MWYISVHNHCICKNKLAERFRIIFTQAVKYYICTFFFFLSLCTFPPKGVLGYEAEMYVLYTLGVVNNLVTNFSDHLVALLVSWVTNQSRQEVIEYPLSNHK